MKKYPRDEWHRLTNAPVEIRRRGEVIRRGTVEDVMPDSSVIWLAADHENPRTLFEASEGFEVWLEARELEGLSAYRMTASVLYGTDANSAATPRDTK